MSIVVRRVRAEDRATVRALREEALRDPAAPIAFLDSIDEFSARGDRFWQERTRGASEGATAAQFVALDGEVWAGVSR